MLACKHSSCQVKTISRPSNPHVHWFSLIFFFMCCLHFGSSPVFLSLSVGVKQEDHDALLVEVQRLEAELGKIRQDLQGVVGCKGKCEQLDTLQETVSNANIDYCVGFT